MSGILRPLFLTFAIISLYTFLIGWAAWAVLVRPGVTRLSVENRLAGERVTVGIPSSIINFGVRTLSAAELVTWIGDSETPRVGPALSLLASDLASAPDVVLLEVDDEDDHVRISKSGGALSLEVIDRKSDVRVSLTPESTARLLESLADL